MSPASRGVAFGSQLRALGGDGGVKLVVRDLPACRGRWSSSDRCSTGGKTRLIEFGWFDGSSLQSADSGGNLSPPGFNLETLGWA